MTNYKDALIHFWLIALKEWKKELANKEMPIIELNPRLKTTAGRAWYDRNYIDLSAELYEKNKASFINDTVPHELAHIIAKIVYDSNGHDNSWYYVYFKLTGKEASRLHSYKVERKVYIYTCNCGKQHNLTIGRHRVLLANPFHYTCSNCKSFLKRV